MFGHPLLSSPFFFNTPLDNLFLLLNLLKFCQIACFIRNMSSLIRHIKMDDRTMKGYVRLIRRQRGCTKRVRATFLLRDFLHLLRNHNAN